MSKADIQELKKAVADLKIMVDTLLKREFTPEFKRLILEDEYQLALRMAAYNPNPLQELLEKYPDLAGSTQKKTGVKL